MGLFIGLLMAISELAYLFIFNALPLWIAGKIVRAQKPSIFRAMRTYLVLYIFIIILEYIFHFRGSSLAILIGLHSLFFLTGALFLKKSFGISSDKVGIYLVVGVLVNIAVASIAWYFLSIGGLDVIRPMMM